MRPLAVLGFLLFALPLAGADTSGGNWIALFDGKSLAGWKASENPASFTVQDGAMVAHGPRAHLFYVGDVQGADFRNFEFAAEVKAAPGANSGIYFHFGVSGNRVSGQGLRGPGQQLGLAAQRLP